MIAISSTQPNHHHKLPKPNSTPTHSSFFVAIINSSSSSHIRNTFSNGFLMLHFSSLLSPFFISEFDQKSITKFFSNQPKFHETYDFG
jgi:hypothetical protein